MLTYNLSGSLRALTQCHCRSSIVLIALPQAGRCADGVNRCRTSCVVVFAAREAEDAERQYRAVLQRHDRRAIAGVFS